MKKRGRPVGSKKSGTRHHRKFYRVNDVELEKIEKAASARGIPLARFAYESVVAAAQEEI